MAPFFKIIFSAFLRCLRSEQSEEADKPWTFRHVCPCDILSHDTLDRQHQQKMTSSPIIDVIPQIHAQKTGSCSCPSFIFKNAHYLCMYHTMSKCIDYCIIFWPFPIKMCLFGRFCEGIISADKSCPKFRYRTIGRQWDNVRLTKADIFE